MKYKFSDLVNIQKLNSLMEDLYRTTGITSSITDAEGNVLVAIGWQEICLRFHRQNLHTEKLCIQSDTYIKQYLEDTKLYPCYKCANGLIDKAAPIIIDGVYVASVFLGQFFWEEPDISYFERQAERYGFDKEAYLAALAKVPIYTPEKIDSIMHYHIKIAKMLAELGMSHLRQIEQQTQESQRSDEQIYKIFNSTPNVAIQSYNEYGNITFLNSAAEHMYGFKEVDVIGKSLNTTIFDDREAERLLNIIKEIDVTNMLYGPIEWKMKHKSGNEKYVYSTLFPIRLSNDKKEFVCMDVDITEKKQLEKEMARLDRLNLIGEMAASIGHEVRNPMTTVRGYLQMFQQKAESAKSHEQFGIMIEELDRANAIITEFLSLAKNKVVEMKCGNLNNVIHTLFPLVQADALRMGHEFIADTGNIPDSYFDEKEIRQLILNLVRNGLEAMEQSGAVIIRTYRGNDEIILSVQDTGPGITEAVLAKLGDPFVTTKDNGTGLGLPVCFRIADRHGAKINVDTGATGTMFIINFPLLSM